MFSLCRGRWRTLVAFVLWLSPAVVSAESVNLAWDPSAGATGYTLRWGTALGSYPSSADAGSSTSFAINGLTGGATYWAVVQAYSSSGVSEFSTPLQFTVPATTVQCTYSISPAGISISSAATSGTILVTTQTGCAWSATSTSGFVTFQNGSGRTGSGSVGFAVAANTTTRLRTGIATVAGKTFTVSQAAATAPACTYSISPASISISAAASSGTILVTTQTGCAWSATSTSAFLTFENGTGRTGSGSVAFAVAANTTSFRTGTATVAGKTFTVWQAAPATAPSCTYSISPASISIPAAAASGTIMVTTQTGCSWNATSMSGFITFQNGTGRSGAGSVGFTVAANTTTNLRTGIAAVAATTFVVSQMGAELDAPGTGASPWSSDFDSDGRNDLLVHDSVGGGVEAWLLDGTTIKGTQPLSHSMDSNWMLVGRGDFNTDGKPDLVWQHKTEGWIYLWYMDGTVRIGGTYPSISRVTDPRWQVVGVGDFNSDGKPDLAWQHTADGALAVWQMSGATVTATPSLIPDRTTDLLWKVVGVADFNGDGKSDLLWRHLGQGDVGVWLMNGVSRIIYSPLSPYAVTDQQWQIAAVTDANGDGRPDLVWEHADGSISIWHMNGTARVSNPSVSATVPMGWHIVGPK